MTPATETAPASACSRPAMRLSSVDLPMPDSPRMAINSPRATSRETPASTVRGRGPGNTLVTFAMRIKAQEWPVDGGRAGRQTGGWSGENNAPQQRVAIDITPADALDPN